MQDFLFIKAGNDYLKVLFPEILYVEARRKYVLIVTKKKSHLVRLSMNCMTDILENEQFCRIHKSYIVSLCRIIGFGTKTVTIEEKRLPIGRQYKGHLLQKLIALNANFKNKPILFVNNKDTVLKILKHKS